MQLTGQNNGGIGSSAFLLVRKCNWLARTCIMNMRNATCVGTQTSKVLTRVTLLFIPSLYCALAIKSYSFQPCKKFLCPMMLENGDHCLKTIILTGNFAITLDRKLWHDMCSPWAEITKYTITIHYTVYARHQIIIDLIILDLTLFCRKLH